MWKFPAIPCGESLRVKLLRWKDFHQKNYLTNCVNGKIGKYGRHVFMVYEREIQVIRGLAPAIEVERIQGYLVWLEDYFDINFYKLDIYRVFAIAFPELSGGEVDAVFDTWLEMEN